MTTWVKTHGTHSNDLWFTVLQDNIMMTHYKGNTRRKKIKNKNKIKTRGHKNIWYYMNPLDLIHPVNKNEEPKPYSSHKDLTDLLKKTF